MNNEAIAHIDRRLDYNKEQLDAARQTIQLATVGQNWEPLIVAQLAQQAIKHSENIHTLYTLRAILVREGSAS
jgi:transcription elongation factor GreA-like protein